VRFLALPLTVYARTRGGLATEFSQLAQNENRKKSEQFTEKLAMSFSICYQMPKLKWLISKS
jgi:hypothetical protein